MSAEPTSRADRRRLSSKPEVSPLLRKEVMYPQKEKPPIGIMPERIWKQKRAEELTEAIARYVSARDYENAERTVIAWCHELEGLVPDLEAG